MSKTDPATLAWRRVEVARLRKAGQPFKTIAQALGLNPEYLRQWAANERRNHAAMVAPLTSPRACLRCRKDFASEGPHHRMCGDCRGISVSPMEPDPGGSTGRRTMARAGA